MNDDDDEGMGLKSEADYLGIARFLALLMVVGIIGVLALATIRLLLT